MGMHSRTRELIAYGEACGFRLDGLDGMNHYRLTHPNGAVYRIPSTPGDYRGDKNAQADMRRLSGVTPPRPHSGRYKRGVRLDRYKPTEERTDSKSWRLQGLQDKHRALCARINECETPKQAYPHVVELIQVEQDIVTLGADPPLRTFRTSN